MNLVNGVFELAEQFMENSRYVTFDLDNIKCLSEEMLKNGLPDFRPPTIQNQYKSIIIELVGSSINYCYWYGKHNIRPGNSSSTFLYELMTNAFFDYEKRDQNKFKLCLERLKDLLNLHRFPLLEERIKHLDELVDEGESFAETVYKRYHDEELYKFLDLMCILFPGFSSDMFLKRASLFFIQLYRRFGWSWFGRDLLNLHVPADYQIPKKLEYFGCIKYNKELKSIIESSTLIPKHSMMECEIRSATILAMRQLNRLTRWTIADVDGWLFSKRDLCKNPFHLTITTDY